MFQPEGAIKQLGFIYYALSRAHVTNVTWWSQGSILILEERKGEAAKQQVVKQHQHNTAQFRDTKSAKPRINC